MIKDFEDLKFGRKDALASVYEKTAPHIYAILCRRLADEDAAQTVMKTVYSLLWTNRHADDAPSDINGLRALAHREAIKYIVSNNLQPKPSTPINASKPNTDVNDDLRQAYLEGRKPSRSKPAKPQLKGRI